MPYWEPVKLEETTAPALANTAVYKFPEDGYVSGLLLNGGVNTKSGVTSTLDDWRYIDAITKVKVTGDETKTIYDLDGETMDGKCFWDTEGLHSLSKWRDYAANTQMIKSWIGFGRKPYDEQYGLDLSRFGSIKFEMTNDMVTANFGTPELNVFALMYRDGVPPFRGYIQSKIFRKWTRVQAAIKYINLPPEGKLRRILLQSVPNRTSGIADTGFHNGMYNIVMKSSGKGLTMFDTNLENLCLLNHFDIGQAMFDSGEIYRVDAEVFSHAIGSRIGGGAFWASVAGNQATEYLTLMDDTGFTMRTESYEADQKINWLFRGYGPENSAMLNFDHRGDGSDFLDLREYKTASLEITCRDSSSADAGIDRVITEIVI